MPYHKPPGGKMSVFSAPDTTLVKDEVKELLDSDLNQIDALGTLIPSPDDVGRDALGTTPDIPREGKEGASRVNRILAGATRVASLGTLDVSKIVPNVTAPTTIRPQDVSKIVPNVTFKVAANKLGAASSIRPSGFLTQQELLSPFLPKVEINKITLDLQTSPIDREPKTLEAHYDKNPHIEAYLRIFPSPHKEVK